MSCRQLHRRTIIGAGGPFARPNSQRSPGLVTGAIGIAGTSSSSVSPAASCIGQLPRQLHVVEAEQMQVELLIFQRGQLLAEHLLVPAGIERELVIGDRQSATLDNR